MALESLPFVEAARELLPPLSDLEAEDPRRAAIEVAEALAQEPRSRERAHLVARATDALAKLEAADRMARTSRCDRCSCVLLDATHTVAAACVRPWTTEPGMRQAIGLLAVALTAVDEHAGVEEFLGRAGVDALTGWLLAPRQ